MNEQESFALERVQNAARQGADGELRDLSLNLLRRASQYNCGYKSDWLGRPIIQLPEDIVAMQEIIWQVQPDLIIETGIAHGGSLIFSASMLELNSACGGAADAKALGIDIDIRSHNRKAIEEHPMFRRIIMLEGSSTAPEIIKQVKETAKNRNKVLVYLDSNHTHDHVLAELEAYAPLVSIGSYCIVFDTTVEDLPDEIYSERPWGKGNNPKTAVWAYLETHKEFMVDKSIQDKLLMTAAMDGYLKRVR
jgi:cephalosporin hydroxylase